jgi:hypothetical protein
MLKDKLLVTFPFIFKFVAVAITLGPKWTFRWLVFQSENTQTWRHVNNVFIQIYIPICTHSCTVSLTVNMKYILNHINPYFHFLVNS